MCERLTEKEQLQKALRALDAVVDAAQGLLNTQPQFPSRLQREAGKYVRESIEQAWLVLKEYGDGS